MKKEKVEEWRPSYKEWLDLWEKVYALERGQSSSFYVTMNKLNECLNPLKERLQRLLDHLHIEDTYVDPGPRWKMTRRRWWRR